MLTRGHERVAPGPPGRADGASGTAVISGVMPLSACRYLPTSNFQTATANLGVGSWRLGVDTQDTPE